jgi:U3 small nucleolar RNA-associated protein 6
VETIICEAKRSVFAIDAQSAEFPLALGMSLSKIKSGISGMTEKERPRLADKAVSFLLPFLRGAEDLDVDVVKVLELSVKRYLRILEQSPKKPGKPAPRDALMKRLQNDGRESDLETVAQLTAG